MNHGKQLAHLRTSMISVSCGNRGNHVIALGMDAFKASNPAHRCAKCDANLEKMQAVSIRREVAAMQPAPWSIEDDLARFPRIKTAARMI